MSSQTVFGNSLIMKMAFSILSEIQSCLASLAYNFRNHYPYPSGNSPQLFISLYKIITYFPICFSFSSTQNDITGSQYSSFPTLS